MSKLLEASVLPLRRVDQGSDPTRKVAAQWTDPLVSPKLYLELFNHYVPDFALELVDFLVSQATSHRAIRYPEAVAFALCLGMHELIDKSHTLGKIARHAPDNFTEVVLGEA